MRLLILIFLFVFIAGCISDDTPPNIEFVKGEFWLDKFRNNSFPSKAYVDDKIYCTAILSGYDHKPYYLYCLNLKTGKVDWASPVQNWASQPPIVTDSFIY